MRKNISMPLKLLAEAQEFCGREGITFSGLLSTALREYLASKVRASASNQGPKSTWQNKEAKKLAADLTAIIESRQSKLGDKVGYEDTYAEIDAFCLHAAKSLNYQALQDIMNLFLYLPEHYKQWKEKDEQT